jgi:hypothetical protein
MRMHGEPDEALENALYAVLNGHVLPDVASMTEATRQVYGDARLIEDHTAAQKEAIIELPVTTPAELGPPEDDSIMRIPLPKAQKGRFKLNYNSLSTSRPV